MTDTPIGIVNIPSIDLLPYFNGVINFILSHYLGVIKEIFAILVTLSIPVSVVLFVSIIVTVERLKHIRVKESAIFDAKVDMGYTDAVVDNKKGNPEIARKWDAVLKQVESQNHNDWRQAVLEADIILGQLLTQMGYRGEGIGEQLQRATKADFKTLDSAWEAHKVRNELAHSGSEFNFNQHEARRIIHLYRKVFEEFYYI